MEIVGGTDGRTSHEVTEELGYCDRKSELDVEDWVLLRLMLFGGDCKGSSPFS